MSIVMIGDYRKRKEINHSRGNKFKNYYWEYKETLQSNTNCPLFSRSPGGRENKFKHVWGAGPGVT